MSSFLDLCDDSRLEISFHLDYLAWSQLISTNHSFYKYFSIHGPKRPESNKILKNLFRHYAPDSLLEILLHKYELRIFLELPLIIKLLGPNRMQILSRHINVVFASKDPHGLYHKKSLYKLDFSDKWSYLDYFTHGLNLSKYSDELVTGYSKMGYFNLLDNLFESLSINNFGPTSKIINSVKEAIKNDDGMLFDKVMDLLLRDEDIATNGGDFLYFYCVKHNRLYLIKPYVMD